MAFEQLDFLYMPTRDVAGDVRYFEEVLGGRVVFAVDGMGARVAAVELTPTPPLVLLADHLEGDTPILVYRVADLAAELAALEGRGWTREATFEIRTGRALVPRARRPATRALPAHAAGGSRALRGPSGLREPYDVPQGSMKSSRSTPSASATRVM